MINKKEILQIVLIFLVAAFFIFLQDFDVMAVRPLGANYSNEATSTAPARDPQSIAAQAGNVTRLDINGYTTTQSWQGYYGNVTGTVQLADNNNKIIYNWSTTNPTGEVYATNKSSNVDWDNIACFNLYNNGDAIENDFNISNDAVDGLNETFNLNNHSQFYTAGQEFSIGECNNTKLFNDAGAGTFDEVLLTDGTDLVYASLLQKDTTGFDGATHDFEMIVLENGHGADSSPTSYYFYVELQ